MSKSPGRHGYKIAISKGMISAAQSARPDAVPLVKPGAEQERGLDQFGTRPATRQLSAQPSFASSSVASSQDAILSDASGHSSQSSVEPSAFATGWKEATRQTNEEKPYALTEVDRFALDVAQVIDHQMATGLRNSSKEERRQPDDSDTDLFFPALFHSICLCDPNMKGNPIQLKTRNFSLGPRGMKVGRAEFLNLPRQSKHACHLSHRPGPDKRPQYILEYSNDLVSVEDDGPKYVLATQMDVTVDMNIIAEVLNAKFWMSQKVKTFLEDFGVSAADHTGFKDVDWIEIANEPENARDAWECMKRAKDELITEDPNVLEFVEMIEDIKWFHSEYFTLSMANQGKGGFWQITYVSPALAGQMDEVRACFNHNPSDIMMELGRILVGKVEATLVIKWGSEGVPKRMYCCPMSGQVRSSWLCFIVSEGIGNLWDLTYSKIPGP